MSWLISKALMNSLCSQEQVAAFSEVTSLDGKQSVQLSGSNTPQAYCAPDKMTGFSRLSRFGMTYKPLMESRGEELLTLYREGFHARTLVQPEKAQELQETDPQCGNTWLGLLGRYNQDTHSWKTAQCSLFEDLELLWETFPKWGMTVNGELYQLPALVQGIRETEFGLSPTPPPPRQLANTQVFGQPSCNITPHNRSKRDVERQFRRGSNEFGNISNSNGLGQSRQGKHGKWLSQETISDRQASIIRPIRESNFWSAEPNVGRVVDGMASRVDRLKAIGNGQVPLCAATAWRLLNDF